MKKKAVLLFGMLIVCTILIYAAGNIQKGLYNKYSASVSKESTDVSAGVKVASNEIEMKEVSQAKTDETSNSESNNTVSKTEPEQDKNNETKAETTKPVSSSNTDNTKAKGAEGTSENKANSVTQPNSTTSNTTSGNSNSTENKTEELKPNLIIMDLINNKTILSTSVKFDGRLLSDILSEVLERSLREGKIKSYALSNVRYIMKDGTITQDAKWRGTPGYISDIDGLIEKKPIASSGWIYYRNGEKVPFGVADQITKSFNDKDTITIKFYRDALNEK